MICVILGADNAQIINRRLGRKLETETRPILCIRVEITDINKKKTVLKNARHLREEEDLTLRNVYIAQDLTPSQREGQKELRRRRKTMLEDLQEKGMTDIVLCCGGGATNEAEYFIIYSKTHHSMRRRGGTTAGLF